LERVDAHGLWSDSYAPIRAHTFDVLTPAANVLRWTPVHFAAESRPPDQRRRRTRRCDQRLANRSWTSGLVWDTVSGDAVFTLDYGIDAPGTCLPWITACCRQIGKPETEPGTITTVVDALSALIPSYASLWMSSLKSYPLNLDFCSWNCLTLAGSQTSKTGFTTRPSGLAPGSDRELQKMGEERRAAFDGSYAVFSPADCCIHSVLYFGTRIWHSLGLTRS